MCAYPHTHPSSEFTTVGDVFSPVANPDRKKPFDIRTVMRAVTDQDHAVLERWAGMADADTTVVLDAHLGGHPVTCRGDELGIDTRETAEDVARRWGTINYEVTSGLAERLPRVYTGG